MVAVFVVVIHILWLLWVVGGYSSKCMRLESSDLLFDESVSSGSDRGRLASRKVAGDDCADIIVVAVAVGVVDSVVLGLHPLLAGDDPLPISAMA
jgi:hypothetical protein